MDGKAENVSLGDLAAKIAAAVEELEGELTFLPDGMPKTLAIKAARDVAFWVDESVVVYPAAAISGTEPA